jgi:proline iminopeptidase
MVPGVFIFRRQLLRFPLVPTTLWAALRGPEMAQLYQAIEPYDHGMLDVSDGNRIYWELCGNPHGKAALVLHGGPGSGCSAGARQHFDPRRYRIVLFDQRGCGRSTPHASDRHTDLATNTTHHLLSDIELLRRHLHVEQWLIFGSSWGSTLALAYAEHHPHRVSELVLAGVATTTRAEIDWITRGVGRLFPEQFARFRAGVPESERDGDLLAAYCRLLNDSDSAVRETAARDWCDWEMALVDVHPDYKPHPRYEHPEFRMAFSRLVTHYWNHNAWLEDGILQREAGRLAGIPGIMIHGRLDLASPLATAWQLAQAWPGSQLVIVAGAGHDSRDPGMSESIVAATDRFAGRGVP